jgi:predicted nucleic acid-binding protein
MIVVDASCLLELLLNSPRAKRIFEALNDHTDEISAPSLIDVEVCHVLRRYVMLKVVSAHRGKEAVEELAEFPMERFPHAVLLSRMWQLRNNLTAYDAAYVALAEVLECVLLTCDGRLASTRGHRAAIELIDLGG